MRNIVASGNLFGEHITISQISKAKARKLYCAGEEIYFQSSNTVPFNMWQSVCPVKLDEDDLNSKIELAKRWNEKLPTKEDQFKIHVNSYRYYNCDNERGNYVTFYEKIN